MSLRSLQKWLLTWLSSFTVEQRGEFFTLLAFGWSRMIQITDGFLSRCGSVELRCWFARALMKTWLTSRLESVLWGLSPYVHTDQSEYVHPVDGLGNVGVKLFNLQNKAQSLWLSSQVWGLGDRTVMWKGSLEESSYTWRMSRWQLPSWGWSGLRIERWLSQLLGAHGVFFLTMGLG